MATWNGVITNAGNIIPSAPNRISAATALIKPTSVGIGVTADFS